MVVLRQPKVQSRANRTRQNDRHGFLVIGAGGVGSKGANKIGQLLDREEAEFNVMRIQLDTDEREYSTADVQISLALTKHQTDEVKANAPLHGDDVALAVQTVGHLLHKNEVGRGARTTPGVTQIMFGYHRFDKVLKGFSEAISQLMDQGVNKIQPLILCSSGGGTGNPLSGLIPKFLDDPDVLNQILAGVSSDILLSPIVATAYPFAYSREALTSRQGILICSNMCGWQMRMELLLAQQLISHVFVVGFANRSGNLANTEERMVNTLAMSMFAYLTNEGYFRSRWTDVLLDVCAPGYCGIDTPELLYPGLLERLQSDEDGGLTNAIS